MTAPPPIQLACNLKLPYEFDLTQSICGGRRMLLKQRPPTSEYCIMIPEEVNRPNMEIVPSVDLTKAFTTSQAFESSKDLVNWAKAVGKEHGYVIIIQKSDYGSDKRRAVMTLGCERGGKYKPSTSVLKRNRTGTKKCNCPFRLRARRSNKDKMWTVLVHSGIHNHDTAEVLQGHSYVGRLNPEEKAMVGEMIEERVKASDILIAIRKHNPTNLTRIKQIYNEKQAYNRLKRGSLTEMQHLMKLLEEHKYAHWSRVQDGTDVVRSLFWAHPDSIHLFNEFPHVVILDSTYKTNRYRIPLLEMVGVTSTNLTYSIAFAYMQNEQKDEVVWAVNRLKDLIINEDNLPKVFVTDKDQVLMEALETVFPAARCLLYGID
ncbi:protein FAR1-RELATED SEQUENCE 5-like [Lotus japonicus]|uniref:protein FAR1-RELATED SEQUENCE 5-like n=1 Tax=Lotus japonicus TaxID=34305 RepID=UPI00258277FB|nr:protein FAR1-RELATED SEQUENCE 5-like [Lotus japonicus]